MAYTYGKEMDLVEYFSKNKNMLPQLCIITGGIYGDTKFDDFASDQVMRFQRYIRQKRVKMKRTGIDQYITVPLDTDIKFKVIKGRNAVGPEEDLRTIIQNNRLPVLLDIVSDFPSDVFGPITHQLIQLLATEEISEYYVQGFCVTNEVIDVSDVGTVIVIPDLTVAVIDGFTDRPKDKFIEHIRIMDQLVKKSTAKFNDGDVDKEIRLIEKKVVRKEDSDSDNEYDYIEPPPLPKPRTESVPSEGQQPKPTVKGGTHDKQEPPIVPRPRQKSSSSDDKSSKSTVTNRPLPTVPNDVDGPPPLLPARDELSQTSTTVRPSAETGQKKKNKPYENERIQPVNPILKQEITESLYEPELYGDLETLECGTEASDTYSFDEADTPTGSQENPTAPKSSESDIETESLAINSKNIQDIVEILGQLKLAKYAEMFEDDMIDGMTLKGFCAEDLKREYGMRHVEAIRLMNFVRLGHIPK